MSTDAESAGELVAAEIVSRLVIDAAYAESVMPSLVRVANISVNSALGADFPKWPLLNAEDIDGDLPVEASSVKDIRVTAEEVGILITITDMLLSSAGLGGLEPYAEELGKALANKIDRDILGNASKFKNKVGRSDMPMTETNFLEAIYTLESGNAKGPFCAVLHPIQVNDLRIALSSSAGAMWGGPSKPAGDLGAFASLYGVDVFKSTNCALVGDGRSRQGVIMPVGSQSGLAYVLKTGANTEFQRDNTLRATQICVTSLYGNDCVSPDADGGVAIVTRNENNGKPLNNAPQTSTGLISEKSAEILMDDGFGAIGFKGGNNG